MASSSKASPAPAGPAVAAAQPPPAGRAWLFGAVLGAVVLAGFCAGFTHIWNFDMFWHLACGEWMFQHGQVLRSDPFSIDPEPRWMDIHWGFQLLVTAFYRLGGFGLMTWLKAALTLAVPLTLVLALRRKVHPGWLAAVACALILAMLDRIRLRPELPTMLLTMVAMWLVDSARRGEGTRRLWLLPPLMTLWVNMHGLYFFGLVILWGSLAGAGLDRLLRRDAALNGPLLSRQAIMPIFTATAACLVSPWPLEAFLHPLTLFSRVSGQAIYFTYGVAELQPTLEALHKHVEVIVLVGLTGLALAANRRRLPAGQVLVLLFFVAIGLMARRNVSLIAPVAGYLLALHGQEALSGLAGRWRGLGRLAGPAGLAALALPILLAGLMATEAIHRFNNSTMRFGPGLLRQNYPVDLARMLGQLQADGHVLCENFGDAGVIHFYSYPRRKTFMDGRLEAHPIQRFIELNRIRRDLRTPLSASMIDLPPQVRFVIVSHTNRQHLSALMQSGRFQLVQIDPPAVCFARTDWRADSPSELPPPNFHDFDRPLDVQTGQVEGFPLGRRLWYRQNPQPLAYWLGSMMLYLGMPPSSSAAAGAQEYSPAQRHALLLAIRHLTAAQEEGLVPPLFTASLLGEAHQHWAGRHPLPAEAAPVDVNLARALHLFGTLDLRELKEEDARSAALEQVLTLVQANLFERAYEAATGLLDALPPAPRVNPPLEFLRVRDSIALKLRQARSMLPDVEGTPLQRARTLMTRQFGLDQQALRVLQEVPQKSPAEWLLLGDLLLRQGLTGQARQAYASAGADRPLREALCDWVEGRFGQAQAGLDAAAPPQASAPAGAAREPAALASLYRALFLEQTGRYGQARQALARAGSQNEELQALIERTRERILLWE